MILSIKWENVLIKSYHNRSLRFFHFETKDRERMSQILFVMKALVSSMWRSKIHWCLHRLFVIRTLGQFFLSQSYSPLGGIGPVMLCYHFFLAWSLDTILFASYRFLCSARSLLTTRSMQMVVDKVSEQALSLKKVASVRIIDTQTLTSKIASRIAAYVISCILAWPAP